MVDYEYMDQATIICARKSMMLVVFNPYTGKRERVRRAEISGFEHVLDDTRPASEINIRIVKQPKLILTPQEIQAEKWRNRNK
jgi:hypothetical protein